MIFDCLLMVIMVFDHIYTGCQQSKPSSAVWNTFGNDFWSSFNGEGEEQKPLGSGGVDLTSPHRGVGGSSARWCGWGQASLSSRMRERFSVLRYPGGSGAVGLELCCSGNLEVSRWHLQRFPMRAGCPGPALHSAGVGSCKSNANSC